MWSFPYENQRTQLRILKPSKEHFRGSPAFPDIPISLEVHELWSDIQTNRDYYFIYVYRYKFIKGNIKLLKFE